MMIPSVVFPNSPPRVRRTQRRSIGEKRVGDQSTSETTTPRDGITAPGNVAADGCDLEAAEMGLLENGAALTHLNDQISQSPAGPSNSVSDHQAEPDQISQSPAGPSNSVSDHQAEPQEVDLDKESKYALGLFPISAASIIAARGFGGGERMPNHLHPVAFRAFILMSVIPLFSSAVVLVLALECPNIPNVAKTVRFMLRVGLGSLFSAYTWVASFLLLGDLFGSIAAFVLLLVFIVILIWYYFFLRRKG